MTRPTTSKIHRLLPLFLVGLLGLTVAAAPAAAAKDRRGHERDGHRYEQRWDDHGRDDHGRYDRRDRRNDRRYDYRRHDDRRYDYRRDGRYRGRDYPRHSFVVPRHIGPGYPGAYTPYRHGRAYYGAHRHYHEVYFFPVIVGGVYHYQPHYYCEGGLYGTGSYLEGYYGPPRSGLSFGFRFNF